MLPLIFSTIRDAKDRAFMEHLYEQFHKLVYSQVWKMTKDEYDVEEIVQESFIHLIEKVGLLQTLPRDRLVNYIITVARNTAYAFFRKKNRLELIPFEDGELAWYSQQMSAGLDEAVIQKAEGEELYKAWSRLKDRDQALLNMKYILDYQNEEIAEVLGVKPESIRMMLTRAKRNLSSELDRAATNKP